MSSQKRYRDWKSSLLSKDSVENLAYLDGIGPKFGWDKATWNGTQLSLGSNNVEATASKYRYIANRSGAIETPTSGVVTPDGIFTVTTGNEIFVITGLGTTREVLVYATHNYVEADIPTPTTFHAVPITGTVERLPSILAEGSNMAKWIATANLITSIDQTNSVIIGIYKLPATAGDVTEMAIPYHYSWKDGESLGGEDGGGAFSFEIKDGSITTAKLADGSVTTAKFNSAAVAPKATVLETPRDFTIGREYKPFDGSTPPSFPMATTVMWHGIINSSGLVRSSGLLTDADWKPEVTINGTGSFYITPGFNPAQYIIIVHPWGISNNIITGVTTTPSRINFFSYYVGSTYTLTPYDTNFRLTILGFGWYV